MKITFFSNYLTHHQIPFCNELSSKENIEFCFVSTIKMEKERLEGGWGIDNIFAYELKEYESERNKKIAERLCLESDVVIFGSCPKKYIKLRLENVDDLPSFLYSERIFKNGRWHMFSPKNLRIRFSKKSIYKKDNFFLLCAGAFVSKDFQLLNCFKNRCFKWGYFPQTRFQEFEYLLNKKGERTIIWVGRFIKWKHPEYAIKLAKKLSKNNINFRLKMIGSGPLKTKIESMVNSFNLSKNITIIEKLSPDNVRELMEQSEVFIFTSDQHEGWGAVLNEAMNSGCAVLCSSKIGAAQFLVKNGVNGLIFKNKSFKDFYKKFTSVFTDKKKINFLGKNALNTIIYEWNEVKATNEFLKLCDSIINNRYFSNNSPLCSTAEKK